MNIVASLFRPAQPVPPEYRGIFTHLYLDIAWFGILNGSTAAFLTIYAARLGATVDQLGLLNAAPAVINLIFAFPAGHWIQQRANAKPVFWASVLYRLFYILLIPLPWLANNPEQVFWILAITFVMNIPGTALTVGFNAIFADTVPSEWRGHVAGVRNSILSFVSIVTTLVCGQILIRFPFPVGYQIVFGLGFIGAMLSSQQLWYLRPGTVKKCPNEPDAPTAVGVDVASHADDPTGDAAIVPVAPAGKAKLIRFELMRGSFGRMIWLLFSFHLAQYLAIPLFSIYQVDVLHLTDQVISFGTALYYVTLFVGSTQLARLTWRLGNQKLTGIGIVILSFYPALMAISHEVGLYLVTCFVGGLAWALVGGALLNYLMERTPDDDRPAHMAWYNLALNAAILVGSLVGPVAAGQMGLSSALIVFAVLRLVSGLAILRWG